MTDPVKTTTKSIATKRAEQASGIQYGCHVDMPEGGTPDECVLDDPMHHREDCMHAVTIDCKNACAYWQPVNASPLSKFTPGVWYDISMAPRVPFDLELFAHGKIWAQCRFEPAGGVVEVDTWFHFGANEGELCVTIKDATHFRLPVTPADQEALEEDRS